MSIIASRLPLFKFLGTVGALNFAYTIFSKNTGASILSIDDYLSINIDPNTKYTIMGMVKPRSIRLGTGLNKKFVITDSINQLKCRFDGMTTVQVKEGDTAILTAYCPDLEKKQNIVVKQYLTKHSMEVTQWKTKNNVSSKSYGLEKFK